MADDKDMRRRRRLSELAGGVFYSSDSPYGHDNPALGLDSEKPPPDEFNHFNSFKMEPTSNGNTSHN
jgi:hypothetical protein